MKDEGRKRKENVRQRMKAEGRRREPDPPQADPEGLRYAFSKRHSGRNPIPATPVRLRRGVPGLRPSTVAEIPDREGILQIAQISRMNTADWSGVNLRNLCHLRTSGPRGPVTAHQKISRV
jgi:hypothetical protein